MEAFLSFVLVILTTGFWLLAVSYADYLVAIQERNLAKLGQRQQANLSVKRLFGLPWGWLQWLISGFVVLAISIVLALPGPLLLFIVSICGFTVFVTMLWTDSVQIKQSEVALESWTPKPPRAMPIGTSHASLYGLHGEHKGRTINCSHDTIIGRSSQCHIRLKKSDVSSQHARIVYAQGSWYIQDMSRWGTLVDGIAVKAQVLKHGSKIRISNTEFEFRIE